jgi:hypothetical protein
MNMYILILILFLISTVSCQTIEDGWKGIQPLKTQKSSIEHLLGEGEKTKDGFYVYETSDFRIVMNYSTASCEANELARGKYNVPKDFVLNYIVYIKKPVEISKLKFDRHNYHRDQKGDTENSVLYLNKDESIIIGSNFQQETEYGGTIYYKPRKVDIEKFKCNEPTGSKIEDGWKGIKPLRTDKKSVEKLLGKPEIDNNGYHGYRTEEAFIRVNYSTLPCQDNQYKRGEYNIPKDTVLNYSVRPQKLTLLSNLNFKKEQYYKDTSGDANSVRLINNEEGITISVQDQEKTEYFSGVDFRPSKDDAEKFKCDKLKP